VEDYFILSVGGFQTRFNPDSYIKYSGRYHNNRQRTTGVKGMFQSLCIASWVYGYVKERKVILPSLVPFIMVTLLFGTKKGESSKISLTYEHKPKFTCINHSVQFQLFRV